MSACLNFFSFLVFYKSEVTWVFHAHSYFFLLPSQLRNYISVYVRVCFNLCIYMYCCMSACVFHGRPLNCKGKSRKKKNCCKCLRFVVFIFTHTVHISIYLHL